MLMSERRSEPKQETAHEIARAAALALDRQYPQMVLPDLACYKLQLGKKELDPEKVSCFNPLASELHT